MAVDLEHPADEVAHYHGEITYPWETTRRTLSFTALCGSAGCVDLPAGTTTGALATLADLYDTLTGGHDDAE